ncbi:MAG: peptidoglycan DD-metalloendopeptidase family protein [bacterium]
MSQASFEHQPKDSAQGGFWSHLFETVLPRTHLIAAAGAATALVAALSLMPTESVEAQRKTVPIQLGGGEAFQNTDDALDDLIELETSDSFELSESLVWHEQTVRSGDSLSTLFKRESLGAAEVHRFVSSSPVAKRLTRLRPGELVEFGYDDKGGLSRVAYNKSRLESLVFERVDDTYSAREIMREPDNVRAFKQGTIRRSLYMDAQEAQLPHNLIMELANIFGWDIDFALDIRKGDHFSVLYEEQYLDGEFIGTGNILAASFTNEGKTFKAVRFVDDLGRADYYSPEGRVMRKAFLRAPLDFTRVSSNFNPNRLHPVFKTKRPHRGVDYAAPRGTPVYAAGQGKVIASAYSKANGNYVFIQHGEKYVTKYLHLNKRRVKKGERVDQRKVIGTVGSTGYATGPHLHYEFLVDGVHRNPRTVKLPDAKPIPAHLRQQFAAQTAPVVAQLDRLVNNRQLAAVNSTDSRG